MSDENEQTTVHEGENDHTQFAVRHAPDPEVRIEETGESPEVTWSYEHDERGQPTPEDFDRVGSLEVKLVVAMTDWDGEVLEAAEEVHDALTELKTAMMDARNLDDEQRQQIALGNLDALPEVTKE
jgi:hypothetical protein